MPEGNPNDPWALSSESYSPETFYTRATDGNGHASVLHIKVSPALLGELQRLVQSRQIPQYQTYADVVRDAVIHRLRYIADQYPGATDLAALEIEQRQAELDRLSVQRESWTKLLSDLKQQLDALIDNGELDEAEWLIDQHEWMDSMTPPYLVKLAKINQRARARIKDARRDFDRAARRATSDL